jgi:hypothetical protein
MRKKLAGLALGASMLAAMPVGPARAQSCNCICLVPDGVGCTVRCVVNWAADFVTSGGQQPGYTCADT